MAPCDRDARLQKTYVGHDGIQVADYEYDATALNLTEPEMRREGAVLGAMTILVGLTYLVVVDYAGSEPVARFTARDAYVFIGAPAVLVLSWLALAGVGIGFGLRRVIPWWFSGLICLLAVGAIWFSVLTANGYINTLARDPRYSCSCAR